ncbi:diaminopropionate ammonia-lyase [Stella humosa]|uniref:Diaminopropionate ammonia-lyase n=1 Tax=Stella humosa TaxID=94 RepID=A0A3N1KZP9_9PROT|nr:diaminopropionate ammonia-lyase [Stella humosa]ROP84657.1 diaminopropionate ammonia-lyase [Stella humosa]BBK34177.1 PLP-dependent lyase/thiolase [Stella humosa]
MPTAIPHRLLPNPRAAGRDAPYGADQRAVLNENAFAEAQGEIARWPGYAPTPLVGLPGLARDLGLDAIWYKDESGRFGLGSFKALGGAYAVFRLLAREIAARTGETVGAADLVAGRHRDLVAGLTVTCATDGNHGRSVAWGARTFGCRCVIYIHETVSEGRRQAIADFGAEVVRTPGNYDDSVRRAADDAARNGWFVVSDTSYPGYVDVPRDVMQGYAVMADEALAQLPAGTLPTHIFVQAGVGGLAAAICGHFWERLGADRPRFVVVEPEKAACLYASAEAGRPTVFPGALDTIMAGLACGEVSLIAWQVLDTGADAFMTIPDDAAIAAMRELAAGAPPVVAGESGVGGLAGLMAAMGDADSRRRLGLDAGSRVLLFGSEGDTDPTLYAELVGRPAAAVRPVA